MKTAYAYASIVLALMNCGDVLAHDHHYHSSSLTTSATTTASATASATAYPTASATANSTGGSPVTAGTCSNCAGVCVTFGATSGDLWYWWNGGPIGGDPSTFATKPIGPVCLTDAGAMFVAGSNIQTNDGGNTKFEWSVGAKTSNFDISVCDGFSVPMVCTGFNGNETSTNTIGGGKLCASDCPADDQNGANCRNPGAHTGNVAAVPSCFLEGAGPDGTEAKNNYWYYDNISVQAIFTDRTNIVCTVGELSSTAKRDVEQSAAELQPRASKHRHHGHQKRAAHGHSPHAVS